LSKTVIFLKQNITASHQSCL